MSFIPGAISSAEFSKVFLVFCMYRAKQVSGEQLGKTENPIKAAAGASVKSVYYVPYVLLVGGTRERPEE